MKQIGETDHGIPPADAPEFFSFRDIYRSYEKEFNMLLSDIVNAGGKIDYSDIQNVPPEKLGNEIADEIDGEFLYHHKSCCGMIETILSIALCCWKSSS